jgi:phosphoheptose isomerase
MALFNFTKFETAYRDIMKSEEWIKACDYYKSSKIILFYGHGGNLGIAEHAAIDCTRITKSEKIGMSLGSSIQVTSLANDNGYDSLFATWLEYTVKALRLGKEDICCVGITSTGKSENFKDGLKYIEENNLKSIYFTANTLQEYKGYHAEIFTDLETYHEAETMALGLTYDLINAAGFKCPSIIKD